MRTLVLAAAMAAAAFAPYAVAQAPAPTPITTVPIDRSAEMANALLARFGRDRPGLAVLVTRDGKTVYERYSGMADIEHDARATEGTRFHVASVSKQFTAYAAAILAAEGKLDLDADIRTYLPDMPDFGKPVTTRQLLNHTSGVRDQWALFVLAGYDFQDFLKQSAALSFLRNQRELNFAPGSQYEYSNGGYGVAAAVVEKVSGQSLRKFLDERVFKPLGMADTFVYDDAGEVVPNRAMSYTSAPTPRLVRLNYNNYGATSLHSTPRDLAKWAQELMQPRLLNAKAVETLRQPGKLNDGTQLTYAHGLSLNPVAGHPTIGHGGSDAGYRASFNVFPDDRTSIIAMSNGQAEIGLLGEQLANIFIRNGDGDITRKDLVPVPTGDEAQKYAGFYATEHTAPVELRVRENQLTALNGAIPTAMFFRSDGRFQFANGMGDPPSAMRLAPNGKDIIRGRGEGVTETLKRIEIAAPTEADLKAIAGAYHSKELDVTYSLRLENESLQLTSVRTTPVAVTPMDKDRFSAAAAYGSVIRIVRDRAGKPSALRISMMGGRLRDVLFERVS